MNDDPSQEISGELLSTALLSAQAAERMYTLFCEHFQSVPKKVFIEDLQEKDLVLLLKCQGVIQGFTTVLLYDCEFNGEEISVVFSGDTIVAEEARRSPALSTTWLGSMEQLRKAHPTRRFFWFLICSGFRTYRFLPVFFKSFYPHHSDPCSPDRLKLVHFLASQRFGSSYSAETGLVLLPGRQAPLRDDLAEVSPARLRNPHISFFLRKNPGHAAGDELVCLCEIHPSNLTRAGQRLLAQFSRTR